MSWFLYFMGMFVTIAFLYELETYDALLNSRPAFNLMDDTWLRRGVAVGGTLLWPFITACIALVLVVLLVTKIIWPEMKAMSSRIWEKVIG